VTSDPQAPAGIPADIAAAILAGFERYWQRFREITAGAKARFERADWTAGRQANRERIDLSDAVVRETVAGLTARFPDARTDERLWPQVKQAYLARLYNHKQPELAETFYNSVACRVLDRTYYRNEYIFWRAAVSTEFLEDGESPTWRSWYPAREGLVRTFEAILRGFDLAVPFENLARDLDCLERAIRQRVPGQDHWHANFQIQVLSSLFFRNKGAYVVGRILNGPHETPFAVPLRHAPVTSGQPRAIFLDALLSQPPQLAALFSLARAYFMVEMEVPSALVTFLRRLMSRKTGSELYMSLGLHKHGKSVFYRELHESLTHSTDSFVIAEGTPGLVMMVFTLPSVPWVFKVIRDEFPPQKETTPAEVRSKYVMVKYHDRAGRMPDALEYSDVALPLNRLDPTLLEELERSCANSLSRDGGRLVIKHLYIERRTTPLDLSLRNASDDQARHLLKEYDLAIRELAQTNIFAGDFMIKNFGVTHWGRVVFYDYDEICLLTDVKFRRLPRARDDEDELRDEPWFSVGPDDVFPEQFLPFLFPPGPLRERFVTEHGTLLDPGWWVAQQEQIRAGIEPELFPYSEDVRLPTGH